MVRGLSLGFVRWRGLEPPRLATHGPQPCLSANSSTSASANPYARRIIIVFMALSSKGFKQVQIHNFASRWQRILKITVQHE